MDKKYLFLLLLFLSAAKFSYGQNNIEFTHITARDGLSLSVVTEILQDKQGFLWFGTYNGLNRYDGYNFKIFLPEPSNSNSISNHSISALFQDSHGYIWVGTQNGLNRYDWRSDTFTRYFHNTSDYHSISNNNIYSIFEDKSGTLWIGTLNGLNKYNRKENNFTVIKKVTERLNPDSLNSITAIAEDKDGILWLGTWNGLTCMQKDGKIVKRFFQQPADSRNFDYRTISSLCIDKQNNVWIGTSGKGLKFFNRKDGTFTTYESHPDDEFSLSYNDITDMYFDKNENLWICTSKGLNRFNIKSKKITRFLHDPDKPLSLASDQVLSIKQDNTGLIWVGNAGGVSRFYEPKNVFSYYEELPGNPGFSLSSNRVNYIYPDNSNTIWTGTFEGLDEIRPGSAGIVHYKHNPKNKNSLCSNFIMSIMRDSRGYLWVGTNDQGLNRINTETGDYKLYSYDITDDNSISNNGIISICEDNKGNLWFGTWWGLNKLNREHDNFTRYMANPADSKSLKNDLIWAIYEDSRGIIWLGTDGGGVSKLNPDNTFTTFVYDSIKGNNICGNRVLSIFESSDGIMWFCTTEGLSRYDYYEGKFTTYNNKNGLPGNLVNSILEDNDGYLWIATDKGLAKLDRKRNTFSNYTIRNGLKELEFTLHAAAKDKNGILYFGCKAGIMYFDPRKIKDDYITAPVVFTDLKIYNQSVPIGQNTLLKKSLQASRSVEIPYNLDVVTIEFALLDYYDVKKNGFSYKLQGFDTDWNDVAGKNSATYTNLPPGEYTFLVKGYNTDGIKGTREASLNITIVPAFYQTVWFKLLLISAVVIFTFVYVHLRTLKIKSQNKVLEQKVAERTTDLDKTINNLNQEIEERIKAEEKVQQSLEEKEVLLREIHHRVKNNLQVISSLLYLQSASIKDNDTLALFQDSQNRIKSMALIHEKLYQSKDFAEINFNDYVTGLIDHLSKSYRKIGIAITCKVEINDVYLGLDTAISCGLIVNELVTNAYKYAFPFSWVEQNSEKDLYITIRVEKLEDDKILLSVKDNGIGIQENVNIKTINSLGLKLVHSMIHQLDGTVEIKREDGTEFLIMFVNSI